MSFAIIIIFTVEKFEILYNMGYRCTVRKNIPHISEVIIHVFSFGGKQMTWV